MDGPHLIYFSDPMCSWCYGFSPVIEAVRRAYGDALPIRLVMGGLRPGTEKAMTPEAAREIAGHWTHVHEASGLPFDPSLIQTGTFVYDTDPAARAVVVVRREGEDVALRFLGAAQRAFYGEARDITSGEVLADLAADLGLDREKFLADWAAEEAKPRPGATTPRPSAPASPASRPWSAGRTSRASTASSPAATPPRSRCWPSCATGSRGSPPSRRRSGIRTFATTRSW